jgi:transcriptional regulator of acetoin/glycerol metabolism
LEHAIEHAFVVCHDRTLTLRHLAPEIRNTSKATGRSSKKTKSAEPRNILQILNQTDWNKAKTARLLGISRPTLYQKIKEFKLSNPSLQP